MEAISKDAELKQSELKEEKVSDGETQKRVRMSFRELEKPENDDKRQAFIRAFRRIKEIKSDDNAYPWNSFWKIAGYHGEPFVTPPSDETENPTWWGGYCQHGNALFPFWHRAYALELEYALRSVMDDGDDVTLPYWDWTSAENIADGTPKILTSATVDMDVDTPDGVKTEKWLNPLRYYRLPEEISKDSSDKYYYKPEGYITRRYPFSGIRSPALHKKWADIHNQKVTNDLLELRSTPAAEFNKNLEWWILMPHKYGKIDNLGKKNNFGKFNSVFRQVHQCLGQQTYTFFSNTTSAQFGVKNLKDKLAGTGVALEQPHNDIHLAVGGFTSIDPKKPREKDEFYFIQGANGDMGENETAAFDPIFFFHHCNVDRLFWVWQKKCQQTTTLEIFPKIPGTVAREDIITAGQTPNEPLNLDTPLIPFALTSRDLIDITRITGSVHGTNYTTGYDYTTGSFDRDTWTTQPEVTGSFVDLSSDANIKNKDAAISQLKDIINSFSEEKTNHQVTVHVTGLGSSIFNVKVGEEGGSVNVWREDFAKVDGIERAAFDGSFVVRAWYSPPGKDRELVGQKGILDRWDASHCQNCQNHRKADLTFSLGDLIISGEEEIEFDIVCRDMENGGHKVIPISTSTDDKSNIKVDNVGFYSIFTNRPQDSDGTHDGIRVDYRRPVAWEEARPVGCSSRCSVI